MSRSSCSCLIRLLRPSSPPEAAHACIIHYIQEGGRGHLCLDPAGNRQISTANYRSPFRYIIGRRRFAKVSCYFVLPLHRYHGRLQSLSFFNEKNVLSFANICSASSILQSSSFVPSFLPSTLLFPLPMLEAGEQTCIWADRSISGALI